MAPSIPLQQFLGPLGQHASDFSTLSFEPWDLVGWPEIGSRAFYRVLAVGTDAFMIDGSNVIQDGG